MNKLTKKVAAPMAMLATALVVLATAMAAPARAQDAQADQYGGQDMASGQLSVTGVIAPRDVGGDRSDVTHLLVDEATGELWGLFSADPAVALDSYGDQRVTVYGYDASSQSTTGESQLAIGVTEVVPADGGEDPGDNPSEPGETATVTFEVTVGDGVREGANLYGSLGGGQAPDLFFCNPNGNGFPACESGATYADTFTAPAGQETSVELYAQTGDGEVYAFYTETREFADGETVGVIYEPVPDVGEPDPPTEPVTETLRGFITFFDGETVRVQQDPNGKVEDPGFCETAIDFTVTQGAAIFRQQGGERVEASADDLREGQAVEVMYEEDPDGFYADICPAQRAAGSVTILDDESSQQPEAPEAPAEAPAEAPQSPAQDGSGNADGNADSDAPVGDDAPGSDEGSNASSAAAGPSHSFAGLGDRMAMLPDTGGVSPGWLLAGAALVLSGGFVIYRMARR